MGNHPFFFAFLLSLYNAFSILVTPLFPHRLLDIATNSAFMPFEFKQGDKYVGFDINL
jgi:ABC-type amino acid transport substrate-binding protein